MPKGAVIGAGLGGLSTAIRLAAAGWKVDIYDRQNFAGGKAGSNTLDGYRFDTGPSLLTLTEVLEDIFSQAGVSMKDYLDIVPLDEICRYFYADGTRLSSFSDIDKFSEEISGETDVSTEALRKYLRYSRRIYDASATLFLTKSLHELPTYFSRSFLKGLARLGRIDPMRTMDAANRSKLDDPRIVQLFNRYATYNGSNPFSAPATINIIPHLEYGIGPAAVRGGIYAIPKALERLAFELGVNFFLGQEVSSILTGDDSHRTVKGLVTRGKHIEYDTVVSNADVHHTYKYLLEDTSAKQFLRYEKLEPSSSGLVFYFGMNSQFPELGLHNIFFSSDYQAEFSNIFEKGVCPDEPTIYINITSKIDETDAPPNSENWFVLINAPHNNKQDWKSIAKSMRQKVITTIENQLGRKIEQYIEVEDTMSPEDIERKTGSAHGSLYGISSNSRMAAFRRHPNRSRRYKGLFFCGGSVHPGGGMPLVMLSGKITADLMRKYYG